MRKLLTAAAAAALVTAPALAEPEYVTIPMEIDVDASAEDTWAAIGGYCDIAVWAPQLDCEITAGEGEIGTIRSLFGGAIQEIMVGKTELSYGYAMPPTEGQFYDLYHGFIEARPVTEDTSKIVYTLFLDVSNLEDQAAKDAAVNGRRAMFEGLLVNMKDLAEAE